MDKQVNFLGGLCQLIHPMSISDFILVTGVGTRRLGEIQDEKLEQTFKQVLQQSNDQQGKTVSVILSTCQQRVPLSQNLHHRLR